MEKSRVLAAVAGVVAAASLSSSPAEAVHTAWNVYTSQGGAVWNVQPIQGNGQSRAYGTCFSNGVTIYGAWKTLGGVSSVNCGPQGFSGTGWQTR